MAQAKPPANGALISALTSAGWSCERFARTLNAYAAASGVPDKVHPKTPYKWINGATPGSPWPLLAATVLSNELGHPLQPQDFGWPVEEEMLAPASIELDVPWTGPGSLQALRSVAEAGRMDRRTFLLLLGAAGTAPAHDWLIARRADDISQKTGTQLPASVLDDLDTITGRLRTMDDTLGSGRLLGLVRSQLSYVTGLIENRSFTESIGRRLHSSAAELLRLAGWLSFDSGRHGQAQRHWIAGLHCAHAAGDRALGANILGFMSCQAKDLGHPRQAVTLAETARAGYASGTPKVSAILALRAAEAYANDDAARACEKAVDEAFDHLGQSPGSSGPPDWSYWLDEAHAHGQAGYCHLVLGNWSRARSHLATSTKLQGTADSREAALRHALLATTYVRQPQADVGGALHYGDKSLAALTGQVDSPRCVGHLRRLAGHLQPYRRNSGVKDFLDRCAAIGS